jgi:hypothetical protein
MAKRLLEFAFTDAPEVARIVDALSKAALGDLVIDLLRRCEGDETLDGTDLAAALRDAVDPVLRARERDRPSVVVVSETKRCHVCKRAPWTCRVCGRHTCEHFCSLKTNDGTACCVRCKK